MMRQSFSYRGVAQGYRGTNSALKFRKLGHHGLALLLALGLWLMSGLPANAAPAAGTVIGNQASATYSDDSATVRTVTSELVTTIVQQVASLTLAANNAKNAAPGGQVSYAHTLVNTGNGPDSFTLSSSNTGAFSLSGVVFYADANGDGVADNATPIITTGTVALGEIFHFVAIATVPANASVSTTNTLTVTATSTFTNTTAASNTDVTTVSTNAVLNVTKAIDVSAGPASGTRTFTLTYTNTGNATASVLTLTDVIPTGMTYVAGSGRWSGTGSTVLTDASSSDNQSGIVYDFGVTLAGRLTAVIGSVPAGASGTLSFQVTINAGLAPGAAASTTNTAVFTYNDGAVLQGARNTNSVQYTVGQSAALTFTGATAPVGAQGGTVSFTNVLTNTGNGSDSFDITLASSTFPAGTTFVLYQPDGVTPLIDSNGNGVPDSGPLAAGAAYNVVVKATLPPNATGGPFSAQFTAAARSNSAITATATDTLTTIANNSVDLTANAAAPGGAGVGAGPGGAAVVTNTVVPGATTRYTLYVNNAAGSTADAFDLQSSTDASFSTQSLPAGWSVVFRDAAEAVNGNTGVVAPGGNKLVYADVTVPAGYAAGTVNLYFRSISSASGASDRLFAATTVSAARSLVVAPNQSGQVFSGGSVVYTHTLTNSGNVLEGDGSASTATLTTTDSSAGFSSVVYWDRNNDGVLDANDPVLTNLSALTGGTNGASTAAGLSPGEQARVFVKVFAPAGSPAGSANTTTLNVSLTGTIAGIAAPAAVFVTDNSSVIAGNLRLTKTQAIDAACDGTADGAYSNANITSALPGGCIRYQITATNLGTTNVLNVVISDATPPNTTYTTTVPAATTVGTVTAPANAAAGTVQATVGTLTPGQSSVLSFGIRINP